MTWVVTVHSGYGSMAEAVDPTHAFVMNDEAQAKAVCEALNAGFMNLSAERWAIYYEALPVRDYILPAPTGQVLADLLATNGGQMKPGHVAIDFLIVAEMIDNGEEFELRPPPVDPEEEAAAIASILGGG